MKKALSLILVLALILSLTACGGSTEPTAAATEAPVETAAPVTEEPVPFEGLEEDYVLHLPIFALSEHYESYGDRGHFYSEYELDEKGNILYWNDRESNAKVGFGYRCTYDADGRLASMTYENSLYGYTQSYEYDELGRLITSTKTEPDDAEYYLTNTRTYDENGMVSGITTQSSSDFYDGGITEVTYERNELGWVVKENSYSVDTDYLHEYTYEYNTAGRVVRYLDTVIDEGVRKWTYENTFEYDFYGFPVKCSVDKTFDYKGDNARWEETAAYAEVGYVETSSAEDELLKAVSEWEAFEGSEILPTPDSVLNGLACEAEEDGAFRFRLPAKDQMPDCHVYERMRATNAFAQKEMRAYSAQEDANQFLMRYEAVLTQILGLKIDKMADKHVVMDGNFSIALLTVEYGEGAYYLVVSMV